MQQDNNLSVPLSPQDKMIFVNGIDADTGDYLVEPLSEASLATMARKENQPSLDINHLNLVQNDQLECCGLPPKTDPTLGEEKAGWGIVAHEEDAHWLTKKLQRLIDHRKNRSELEVKILTYKTGESLEDFLARYKMPVGELDPKTIPFYLLIAGSPEKIPFLFGQQLDIDYAVGRLHFDDPDDYSAYADNVIAHETGRVALPQKEVSFFGTNHDDSTQLSLRGLIEPLLPIPRDEGFEVKQALADAATKTALKSFINQENGHSAVLFTATHGLGFPKEDSQQYTKQGSLVCAGWQMGKSINDSHYFSSGDVGNGTSPTVVFCYACYGAGTPDIDRYFGNANEAKQIATKPFIAHLAKKLLQTGTLAYVSHVDRAWSTSFATVGLGSHVKTFENTLQRILMNQPIGWALDEFNKKYATVSTLLCADLEVKPPKTLPSARKLSMQWLTRNDLEGYVLIGDPVVRTMIPSNTL